MRSIPYPENIDCTIFHSLGHLKEKNTRAKNNFEMWDDRSVRVFRTGEKVADAALIQFEMECAAKAEAEDKAGGASPEQRILRAFDIGFLVAMTYEFDLWLWKSIDVVEFFVKPLTEERRCRFAELPEFKKYTGKADIIISHSWVSLELHI